MRPVILISASTQKQGAEMGDLSVSLSLNYPLAIEAGGGVPWLLPCMPERAFIEESVARCDGVLLTGGDDVNPELYSKSLAPELRKTVEAEAPERDLFELMLIEELFRQRKPLLAICRGHQLLNVALGGTLVVDISSEIPGALKHSQSERKYKIVHDVEVKPGSLLEKSTGVKSLGVNSTHHQAIAELAKPLRANAVSRDGIIEGVELEPAAGRLLPFLLAVQFHPERLFARHREHLKLFKSFIEACRDNRRREYEAKNSAGGRSGRTP
jgi:putative glutamine amidotransferase